MVAVHCLNLLYILSSFQWWEDLFKTTAVGHYQNRIPIYMLLLLKCYHIVPGILLANVSDYIFCILRNLKTIKQ